MSPILSERYRGSLLGLACGDAVGTTVEFARRGTFPPVTGMTGGGPFNLEPGQWTDDTSMALCLAVSLLECGTSDPLDQMNRYCKWWKEGYLSSTGDCFDIGNTVADALRRFKHTGNPIAGATDPRSAGNGSLMRLAPVPLFFFPDMDAVVHWSGESSRTTHGAAEAVEACKLFALLLGKILSGTPKEELHSSCDIALQEPKIIEIATGRYLHRSRDKMQGTGYCVDALEAALWCFQTTSTFEAAVLEAVNLGDDADTTGAIVGQIAGTYYGVASIPAEWLELLHMRDEIDQIAERLLNLRG